MPNDPTPAERLDAPAIQNEAAVIIGVIIAALTALVEVIGAGGFEDGFQAADLIPVGLVILGALGIRTQVFSATSAKEIAQAARAGTTKAPNA